MKIVLDWTALCMVDKKHLMSLNSARDITGHVARAFVSGVARPFSGVGEFSFFRNSVAVMPLTKKCPDCDRKSECPCGHAFRSKRIVHL